MLHTKEIVKFGSLFRTKLEELVEQLKYLVIIQNSDEFTIKDVEEGQLNEVWAVDIELYILCHELRREGNVYDKIIDWCHEMMLNNDALIFDPHSCR